VNVLPCEELHSNALVPDDLLNRLSASGFSRPCSRELLAQTG
jgi:hypothetical protein